ncbi:MAG: RNA 2',3'-cyclic phosphodiesterase [Acidiferrobacterales bacterium]|nr:RNA 2',3'-cyclic phosphodiesterase [Acidiferrobacterales bacterium]
MQRLFVALWPDHEVREQLVDIQTEFGLSTLGRLVPARNLHITLQFLGEVPPAEVEPARQFVRDLRFPPFAIEFDCVGSWPRNEVAWVGSENPCQQLDDLVAKIRGGLPDGSRKSRNFVPHITLARKVRRKLYQPIKPMRWSVSRVDLVRSVLDSQGAQYESIAHCAGVGSVDKLR